MDFKFDSLKFNDKKIYRNIHFLSVPLSKETFIKGQINWRKNKVELMDSLFNIQSPPIYFYDYELFHFDTYKKEGYDYSKPKY